jgi:hypothetical protein
VTGAARLIFFAGTAIVVWLTHRSVLRRAGHSACGFLRACVQQYTFYLRPTNAMRRSGAVRRPGAVQRTGANSMRAVSSRTARASSHRHSSGGIV